MWMRQGLWAAVILSTLTFGVTGVEPPADEEGGCEEGIEFSSPLVSECMSMVRDGRTADAITRLNQAIKSSAGGSADKTLDLKLGLAMVYLRSHQKPKALHMLRPIAENSGQDAGALRSVLLMRAAKQMPERRKSVQDLSSIDGWQELLGDVRQDLAKTLEREHVALSEAIQRRSLDDVSKHLANAQQQVDLAQLIKTPSVSARRDELMRTHLSALRTEIFEFNLLCRNPFLGT